MVIVLIIKFLRKVVKKSNIWKSWDHVKTNYRRWVSLASVKQTRFFMTPSPIESLLFCVWMTLKSAFFLDHFSSVMSDDKNLEKNLSQKFLFHLEHFFYFSLSLSLSLSLSKYANTAEWGILENFALNEWNSEEKIKSFFHIKKHKLQLLERQIKWVIKELFILAPSVKLQQSNFSIQHQCLLNHWFKLS